MNDVAELQLEPTSTGTELSVIERAKLALASGHAETVLTELAKKYTDLARIMNRTDYQIVMSAIGEFRRHRLSIERTGKMARDDANKFADAIRKEEKRLKGIIGPEEDRLDEVRQVWDNEQKRIKREAEEAEEARKAALREKCFSFERMVAFATGLHSSGIKEVINRLNATIITTAEFQDFARQAEGALIAAKDHATRLLAETLERERQAAEARAAAAAEAERRQQEAAELAKQREENERAAAELRSHQEAIRREQQEEAARLEQARAEIERQRKEAAAELARLNAEVERRRQEAEQVKTPTIQPEPPKPEPEPEAAPHPTLAEDLEGWRIRFKVNQKAHDALLTILASHQV